MTERNAMDANEKLVREHLDGVKQGASGVIWWQALPQFDSWSAAAEFTRARLEQIRQVEEEIALVTHEYKRATVCGVSMGGATGKALAWQRVIEREQAALAELKRGMK
jgi:hypothetical protein